MSASSARPFAPAVALLATVALANACGSDGPPPPHGSPVLTEVYWVAGAASKLVWSRTPNVKFDPAVPAYATEIDFVFDRRLNGDGIEDRFTVGGVMMTKPKAMPPITVSWPDKAEQPGVPPLTLVVAYNSTARFGPDSSYVFARPIPAGFPSDTLVTFALDLSKLTSEYGEPASAPANIPVKTTPFSVTIAVPTGPVGTAFPVPLVFSNRVVGETLVGSFVRVTTGGAIVPSKILADANDPSRVYVAPADCLGAWPPSATLNVTVRTGIADAFGHALEKDATATFETGMRSSTSPATCTLGDGGTADAAGDASADAAGDAPADAGTEAVDAAVDAGVDAADAASVD